MKANELMIGDWVKIKDGFPIEMQDVSGTSMFRRWSSDGKIMIPYGWDEIEPIPLTKEILEKNGFKIVYGFGYSDKYPTLGWGYHNGIHDYCSIDVTFYDTPINGVSHLVKINRNSASVDGINTVHNCDIDYVHQLQHAIRLCGIDKEIEL